MHVTDVLAQAPNLLGKPVQIEGVLIGKHEIPGEIRSPVIWHIATPEAIDNTTGKIDYKQAIHLIRPARKTAQERQEEKEDRNRYLLEKDQRLEAFFGKFSGNGEYSHFSEEKIRKLYARLKSGDATQNDIDWLVENNLLNPFIDAVYYFRPPKHSEFFYILDNILPWGIPSRQFISCPGSVVGTLDLSLTGPTAYALKDITKVVGEVENSFRHIASEAIELSQIDLGEEAIIPAMQILQTPAHYIGQRVRVAGEMISRRGNYFVTERIYSHFPNWETHSIYIDDETFIKKIWDVNLLCIGGEPNRYESMQLVGEIMPSNKDPFPLQITNITAAVSLALFNEAYQWKL